MGRRPGRGGAVLLSRRLSAGIGSEGYVSLVTGRRFLGIELKASYYKQMESNLRAALEGQGNLFEEAV